MINRYDGKHLINALQKTNIVGRFIPMVCNTNVVETISQNYCKEVLSDDKYYVANLNFTGTLMTSLGVSYIYRQGEFGSRLEYGRSTEIWKSNNHSTLDLCGDSIMMGMTDYKDKAILVERGGCDFATKAETLSKMGASLMLLVNHDDNIMTMGVDSDYRGSKIEIASIMIPKSAGDHLMSSSDNIVSITLN